MINMWRCMYMTTWHIYIDYNSFMLYERKLLMEGFEWDIIILVLIFICCSRCFHCRVKESARNENCVKIYDNLYSKGLLLTVSHMQIMWPCSVYKFLKWMTSIRCLSCDRILTGKAVFFLCEDKNKSSSHNNGENNESCAHSNCRIKLYQATFTS